uniref:Glutaredoxin domain-containing protein n=1 Tax=viral metagenome TaxID=1070528 RepID=A0A6C0JVN5_9ZZZZ
MSQPYLFYSERCPNCKQIIETLKALNKAGLYKFILVESLPRDKIPAFLKKVPTLYVPDTKDVIVGKDIFGYIAKPTNSRKELPTTATAPVAPGEYSPWGFEGSGEIGERYSLWNSPNEFTSESGSMYTFLNQPIMTHGGAGVASEAQPSSTNTSKAGRNSDVSARLEELQKQREKEFGGVSQK